jgi:hypothetical protein
MNMAADQARKSNETLRVYTHKMRHVDYTKKIVKRVEKNFNPFTDPNSIDNDYVKQIYDFWSLK